MCWSFVGGVISPRLNITGYSIVKPRKGRTIVRREGVGIFCCGWL